MPTMTRLMPATDKLPYALYRADQVRELDRIAIEECGIAGATLMERAGQAAFSMLRKRWPEARDITVVCGVGNNGGDGYVIARLARESGLSVRIMTLGDTDKLHGDALAMARAWGAVGGETESLIALPEKTDVIVDAVLGTGLERKVSGDWAQALDRINRHRAPVLAVDLPSGLHSDTGKVLGIAVRASATVSFIGLKQGMFTGEGPEYCGDLSFDALQVPARIYARQILSARRIDWEKQSKLLQIRPRTAHKGRFGHVLVIGGDLGFSGAPRMTAEASARTGAGLVTVATRPEHAALLNLARPELMCHAVSAPAELEPLLERASVVAIGPGLGRSDWSRSLWQRVLSTDKPLVVDADALNLMAAEPVWRDAWVLTPHPGEAARLLGCTTDKIQADRFGAVRRLREKYGGICVLKGAGSLVQGDSARPPAVCTDGNPGMASGGMGDVLTGIVAGLLAQGIGSEDAACMGVCLHGAAADAAARQGERGLLAGDLMPQIRTLVNPLS